MKITDEVDGLIHVSEISDQRISTPSEILTIGDKVQAKIIGINEEKKQVRLSMRNLLGPPPIPESRVPRKRSRKRDRIEPPLPDNGGHEALSMRDLLGDTGLETEEEAEE